MKGDERMRVLCAYRDPVNGAAALRETRKLVRENDEVVALHVVEPAHLPWHLAERELVDQAEHDMETRETLIADAAAAEGLRASVVVDVPNPGESTGERIAREARERNADLLVVVSKRASGVRGLLLGSVAQALLHLAPCPVVVARPPE